MTRSDIYIYIHIYYITVRRETAQSSTQFQDFQLWSCVHREESTEQNALTATGPSPSTLSQSWLVILRSLQFPSAATGPSTTWSAIRALPVVVDLARRDACVWNFLVLLPALHSFSWYHFHFHLHSLKLYKSKQGIRLRPVPLFVRRMLSVRATATCVYLLIRFSMIKIFHFLQSFLWSYEL